MVKKVALVDDEQTIVSTLQIALEEEGFDVTGFTDSQEALPRLLANEFDAAILDIKMPRIDGIEILTQVRQQSNMPIMMLTSKDHEIDEVIGLHMGADDYLKKPFSIRLVIARLRACLRRYAKFSDPSTSDKDDNDILIVGDLRLDLNRHLCLLQETPINMTVTEFLLLRCLAERPGHVRSRQQLMDAAYGDNIHVEDRTIDSHIKRIRRKLREIDHSFDKLETLYGVGYRYQE